MGDLLGERVVGQVVADALSGLDVGCGRCGDLDGFGLQPGGGAHHLVADVADLRSHGGEGGGVDLGGVDRGGVREGGGCGWCLDDNGGAGGTVGFRGGYAGAWPGAGEQSRRGREVEAAAGLVDRWRGGCGAVLVDGVDDGEQVDAESVRDTQGLALLLVAGHPGDDGGGFAQGVDAGFDPVVRLGQRSRILVNDEVLQRPAVADRLAEGVGASVGEQLRGVFDRSYSPGFFGVASWFVRVVAG